ncbi:translation initiation factor IF-2 subunit alpha [Candidatus Woesearchaeota archaeon]|nr:translation initiation factor IF-2 subunit alpha [Candidatus Woesearchaeota archaeon]
MLIIKKGFPEEGELVLCTVTNIQYHSVFVKLDEYDKTGMIHISEVSPGRIRNIRDFVKEDKKVVCKVLRINEEKGHIDLSLRRVGENQKREKLAQIKNESKAEKLVEILAGRINVPVRELYEKLLNSVSENYDYLYDAFEDIVENDVPILDTGVPKEYAKELESIVRDKIKVREVQIGGDIKAFTYAEEGLKLIKEALTKAEDSSPAVTIKYKGAGVYSISVIAHEYKEAEKVLKGAVDTATDIVQKGHGVLEFTRHEK